LAVTLPTFEGRQFIMKLLIIEPDAVEVEERTLYKTFGFIKGGEFLEQLSDYKLLEDELDIFPSVFVYGERGLFGRAYHQ
jgi:hypothetical protein